MLGHTTEKEAGQAVSYVDWPGIAGTLSAPMRQVWLVRYIRVRVTDSCHNVTTNILELYLLLQNTLSPSEATEPPEL